MNNEVRTRYAPSPTGYMHIGNLRTALYEYLIAKKNNGKFILRIEDTDQQRYVEGAIDVIYKTLKMAGLEHDEGPDVGGSFGPYVQSERKNLYLPYAKELIALGEAYYCFCTKERLLDVKATHEAQGISSSYDRHCLALSAVEIEKNLAKNVPYVIRQKMPQNGTNEYHDAVYGTISIENSTLEDQVLIKSDGLPTYNFANVVDDHLMEITHVVRGSEYLSSTPKYNLLYKAFGWEIPTYVHLPVVTKPGGQKISKREGDASFEDLIAMGYLVDAVINYVALLGWSPGDEREFFTLSELEQAFSIENISKSPSTFDFDKLNWMNGEYIRKLSPEAFFDVAKPYLEKAITERMIDLFKVSKILQARTEVLTQISQNVDFFNALPAYENEIYVHKKMKTTLEISLESLKAALPVLEALPSWDHESLHASMIALVEQMGIKNSQMLWPLRIAISGKAVTPGGAIEIADILGKQESLRRIKIALEKLDI